MATYYAAKLYDKTGTYLGPAINSTTTEFTVQDILNSDLCTTNNITAIAASVGGTALSPSNSVKTGESEGSYITDDDMYKVYRFYDVTPTPATLTSHGHIGTWHIQTSHPFECYDEYIRWDWDGTYVALKEVTSTHGTALYNKINEAKIAKHGSTSSRITIEEFYDYISGGECNLDAISEDYRTDYLSACFCRDGASDGSFNLPGIPVDYGSAVDEGVAIVGRILDDGGVEVKYVYDREQFGIKLSDYTAGESIVYLHVPLEVNNYLKANDKSFVLPYYIDL